MALTRWTFVGKVMSLLSRLVIAFLPRSKHLLISWLQSPSAYDIYIVNFLPFRAFKMRLTHNINATRAFGGLLVEEMEKAFCPGYQPRASAWPVSLPEFWGSPVLLLTL